MKLGYPTPQDAEDAFYDAVDEGDLTGLLSVWENSDDVVCLLPMQELQRGIESVMKSWKPLIEGQVKIDIEVRHLHWLIGTDLAIHLVEERVTFVGHNQKQPPVYATNVYRNGPNGWRMIVHQNSPAPPPPGIMPPRPAI